MADWMWWGVLTGILLIAEILTGTFYLLMVAIGFVAGGIAAYAGAGLAPQIIVAAFVAASAVTMLNKIRPQSTAKSSDTENSLDIGQVIRVDEWRDIGNGRFVTRACHRGCQWDVELLAGHPVAGNFLIEEVRGNTLVVRS
ncbi:NfeD family protein [Undibacterium squillarum]|uniref:Membrane protein n=1 Tax=Undibacterium squillarum TaxID=1131567 RepID=A0ABQ2XQU5_9BURK|nr:NfeD family protein [Undibacterium squillarum]GGX29275.1 membrane protein [Undibacterium squillarum]